jgi:ACS family tartrate transporter-like MFS transporter
MPPGPSDIEASTIRKAAWRLIPFLGVLYFISFLDRVNIGFAALTMNQALGLTATEFGTGAGIFFLGYILLEVPSNLVLDRVGARYWIARIMITWGFVSAAMAFVTGPASFYALRFLLGLAEAGFFPGIILYLTYWFPAPYRARIVAAFMVAIPISTVVGAPISTWLLGIERLGLAGWQWLFIAEGLPAVIAGIAVLFWMQDRPDRARWLTEAEREWLVRTLEAERAERAVRHGESLRTTLTSVRTWGFGFIYFGIVFAVYGLNIWFPQIVKGFGGLSNERVGLLVALPYLFAAIAMILAGRHSDRTGERALHVAIPAFAGAIGLAASAWFIHTPALAYGALALGTVGTYAAFPAFWAMPTAMLSGASAAGGIALINAVGNSAGYFGPFLVGYAKDRFGGFEYGMMMLAAFLVAAAILALAVGGRAKHAMTPELFR